MKKILSPGPVWHAVFWILAYVLLVSLGDGVSERLGEPNSATAPLLVIFSIVLFAHVARYGWSGHYGLRLPHKDQFQGTLLYLPLVVLVVLQYARSYREDLSLTAVLLIIALMVSVGFIEELVFRGFLFRALLSRGNLTRAVIISGVTFSLGHIVNLARGYTGTEQITQIVAAVALGVVLVLLFAVSGTLVPLIAFHALFNIGGSVTSPTPGSESAMLAATVVLSTGYAIYLIMVLRTRGMHPTLRQELPVGDEAPTGEGPRALA